MIGLNIQAKRMMLLRATDVCLYGYIFDQVIYKLKTIAERLCKR